MQSIRLTAPAKVNLFLKVLNKRKDSYHNILTLFERISLADEVTISKIPKGIEVSSDRFITRDPEENLAFKAARLMISEKALTAGVRISIKKRIPMAAGLGGGSSDAASTIIGMNRLFKLGLGKERLGRLAGRIGADCPFFISDVPLAVGRSRGDLLERVPSRLRLWHVIVYPDFEVSTRAVYEAFDRSRKAAGAGGLTMDSDDVKIRFSSADALDFDAVESMLHNDLQDIVTTRKRAVGKVIRRLASSLGKRAILSGSGPSVFCLFRSRKEAMRARNLLLDGMSAAERSKWQIFVASTM